MKIPKFQERPTDLTEEECREIISPIISKATKVFSSDFMVKLTTSARDESMKCPAPHCFIADFWKHVERRYLTS